MTQSVGVRENVRKCLDVWFSKKPLARVATLSPKVMSSPNLFKDSSPSPMWLTTRNNPAPSLSTSFLPVRAGLSPCMRPAQSLQLSSPTVEGSNSRSTSPIGVTSPSANASNSSRYRILLDSVAECQRVETACRRHLVQMSAKLQSHVDDTPHATIKSLDGFADESHAVDGNLDWSLGNAGINTFILPLNEEMGCAMPQNMKKSDKTELPLMQTQVAEEENSICISAHIRQLCSSLCERLPDFSVTLLEQQMRYLLPGDHVGLERSDKKKSFFQGKIISSINNLPSSNTSYCTFDGSIISKSYSLFKSTNDAYETKASNIEDDFVRVCVGGVVESICLIALDRSASVTEDDDTIVVKSIVLSAACFVQSIDRWICHIENGLIDRLNNTNGAEDSDCCFSKDIHQWLSADITPSKDIVVAGTNSTSAKEEAVTNLSYALYIQTLNRMLWRQERQFIIVVMMFQLLDHCLGKLGDTKERKCSTQVADSFCENYVGCALALVDVSDLVPSTRIERRVVRHKLPLNSNDVAGGRVSLLSIISSVWLVLSMSDCVSKGTNDCTSPSVFTLITQWIVDIFDMEMHADGAKLDSSTLVSAVLASEQQNHPIRLLGSTQPIGQPAIVSIQWKYNVNEVLSSHIDGWLAIPTECWECIQLLVCNNHNGKSAEKSTESIQLEITALLDANPILERNVYYYPPVSVSKPRALKFSEDKMDSNTTRLCKQMNGKSLLHWASQVIHLVLVISYHYHYSFCYISPDGTGSIVEYVMGKAS